MDQPPPPPPPPPLPAHDLKLRGDRFAPLSHETMTPEQRAMTDAVLVGRRGSMQGPYNVMLRSPAVGQLAQAFGAQARFGSSLPLRLNELAILVIAADWRCRFMAHAHRSIAIEAGLAEAVVDGVARGETPPGLQADEAAVLQFCRELQATREVGDATFAAVRDAFGERGVFDLIATLGYYTLVAMSLNVDRYPLPEAKPPAGVLRV